MRGLLTAAMLPAFLGLGYAFFTAPRSALAAELQSGSTVIVAGTDGSGLRIRSAPGIGSTVLVTVKEGSRLQILDGPQVADGLEWYKVKSETQTGWSSAKYLSATPSDRTVKSLTAYDTELATPIPPIPSGARVIVSPTTAYATGNKGVGTRTATGTTVRWGTVSVDPTVIPFGSQLLIDGFEGTVFTAEDRGSGIKGTHVDIFFPEAAVAGKYGTQQRKVTIVREGYGR